MSTTLKEKRTLVLKAVVNILKTHKTLRGFDLGVHHTPGLFFRRNEGDMWHQLLPNGNGTLVCVHNSSPTAVVVLADPDSMNLLAEIIFYCVRPPVTFPCSTCPGVKS